MSENYESELIATREEAAAVLSGVADGLLSGSIRLGDGADAVAIDTPDEFDLEIELEFEDGDVSLELELEWPHPEGEEPVGAPVETPTEAEDEPTAQVGAADASQSLARFEVFRDRGDEWRWRLRHRNGNVVASSGEGYTRKHNAWKGLRSVMQNAPEAEVTEEGTD